MRIVIVTPDYPPIGGGVARSVRRIATALGSRSHDVTVVVPHRASEVIARPTIEARESATHTILDVYCPIAETAPSWHLSNLGLLPQFFLAVRRYLQSLSFDILHCFTLYPLGGVCSLLAHEIGVPLVVSIRGGDIMANMFAPTLVSHLRQVLDSADLVCPVSDDLGRYASHIAPSANGKCVTVSNGSDIDMARKVCPVAKPTTFTFGTVATYRPKKDLETVLLAFHEIQRWQQECRLIVVGINDEKERQELEDNHQSVTVLPEQDYEEIHKIIGGFHALIISSVFEGCPNVLMESFAVGTPVVGSAVGGMADRVKDGFNGLLCEPMSVNQLVSCMQRVMDPALRAHLATGARESATTAAEEAAEWEAAYAKATENLRLRR